MSIFSNLKYPVSRPPTAAQLEALPPQVYKQWINEVAIGSDSALTPAFTAGVLSRVDDEMMQRGIDRLECIVYSLDE